MTDTTKLPASFSNGAVFESSTAFLMLQKNAKKRQTTMTDDVFRIFRRTGKKINEIANRIEGERNIYLKDSYNNKNTLYKELSGISNIKPGQNELRKTVRMKNHLTSLPRVSSVPTSDLIYRPVKSQLGRQKLGEEAEFEPEKRINVNVLKRCECCRRLAFRYKEMTEKQREIEEAEERKKNEENGGENTSSETLKLTQEVLDSVRLTPNINNDDGRKRSQLSFYTIRDMPETREISRSQIVPTSFSSLRRQSKANLEKSEKKVTVHDPPVTAPPSPDKLEKKISRCRSYSVLMNTDKASRPEPTPSPLSRQKIRVKFENPNAKEKLKLQGNAWRNHLRRLHGQEEGEKQTVVALSKAYIAFKKLLRQMEEERRKEEEDALNDDRSSDSSGENSPLPRNRFYSTAISLAASLRWQPKRESKRADSLIPGIDDIIESASDKEVNFNEERVSQSGDSDKNVGFFTVLECNS